MSSKTRKFAIGAAAAGIAALIFVPVSGAGFSASDTGTVTVDTATVSLNLSDDQNQGTFDLRFMNLVPGGNAADTFTVTNTGDVPVNVKIGPPITVTSQNLAGLTSADLAELKVSVDGYLPATALTALPSSISLGALNPGQSFTYTVRTSLDSSAGNEWQSRTVSGSVTVTVES